MRIWTENGTPVDIFQENKALFMDLTSAYFFGLKNASNLTEDPDKKIVLRNFELGFSDVFWRLDVPNLTKLMAFFGMSPLSEGILPAYQAMEDFILSLANQARDTLQSGEVSNSESYPTLYAQLRQKLEASKTIPPEQLDAVVAAEMLDHIGASHEALSVTVTYLILYPPGTGPFTRQVPEKGATIGLYSVPGGTTVGASPYTLHRNSQVFPNPLDWSPDRWLDATPEVKKEMMRWYWVFGSGGRMCIGNHLAIRLMKAVVVAVFKEFESVEVPETRIEHVEGLIGHPVDHSVVLAFKKPEFIAS
ncbi:hypothetical protein EYC80_011002 [Monilinia laxa]|uniref:Cytochrome P450 n=1 Tax=Monilinia laxa TaxID=61186 RepID=A0A5N6JNQ8_MONLA|nr:hypothetical protein EYC80_011002 [Monilinia laxa]